MPVVESGNLLPRTLASMRVIRIKPRMSIIMDPSIILSFWVCNPGL